MVDLKRGSVLLSASFPSGERGRRFKPYDPSGIADAVSAFSRAILKSNGKLVFGGHPTITPLVLMISRELQVKDSVIVFQSRWFEDLRIPEVAEIEDEQLGVVKWTRKGNTRDESVQLMRAEMVESIRYSGALFIGGMEGISAEHDMVKGQDCRIPCVPVAGPGGATSELPMQDCETLGLATFKRSRAYPLLALQFVQALSTLL